MSITLRGAALRSEATRLNIPGRSRMTADELRAAVAAAVSDPIPAEPSDFATLLNPPAETYGAQPSANDATQALNGLFGAPSTPTPFRARNGKHKPSAVRRNRRK